MPPTDPAHSAESFRSGDATAFAALVREYTPRLLGMALRLTRDQTAAEDLVQETWIAAYQKRASFADGSLLAWLLVILRRCFLQHYRSSERRIVREQRYVSEQPAQQHACDEADTNHKTERVLAVLDELSSRQRDVVVERIMGGRSTADTARRLGIAEGTVKATLSQALHRLRHLLNSTDDLP